MVKGGGEGTIGRVRGTSFQVEGDEGTVFKEGGAGPEEYRFNQWERGVSDRRWK